MARLRGEDASRCGSCLGELTGLFVAQGHAVPGLGIVCPVCDRSERGERSSVRPADRSNWAKPSRRSWRSSPPRSAAFLAVEIASSSSPERASVMERSREWIGVFGERGRQIASCAHGGLELARVDGAHDGGDLLLRRCTSHPRNCLRFADCYQGEETHMIGPSSARFGCR